MKILIAGASGFIGQHLVPFLTKNHDITILGRSMAKLKRCFPQQKGINWNDLKSEPVADYQLVINLCGESIANKRWTKQQKIKILQSRIETTTTLCRWALTSQKPQSLRFLNASAVGIYGLNTKHNTEDTPINKQPRCFSQHIVNTWEATVKKNLDSHLSYTLMRFGVVLKKQCGMLQKLELPYKLGMASTLGDGKQLISWVHIDDLIHAISFIIDHPQLSGPVNIVSPETPTQKQFATILTTNESSFSLIPPLLIGAAITLISATLLFRRYRKKGGGQILTE